MKIYDDVVSVDTEQGVVVSGGYSDYMLKVSRCGGVYLAEESRDQLSRIESMLEKLLIIELEKVKK